MSQLFYATPDCKFCNPQSEWEAAKNEAVEWSGVKWSQNLISGGGYYECSISNEKAANSGLASRAEGIAWKRARRGRGRHLFEPDRQSRQTFPWADLGGVGITGWPHRIDTVNQAFLIFRFM